MSYINYGRMVDFLMFIQIFTIEKKQNTGFLNRKIQKKLAWTALNDGVHAECAAWTTLDAVVHAKCVAWTTLNTMVHAECVAWTALNTRVHAECAT